jgi:hypothetical protein
MASHSFHVNPPACPAVSPDLASLLPEIMRLALQITKSYKECNSFPVFAVQPGSEPERPAQTDRIEGSLQGNEANTAAVPRNSKPAKKKTGRKPTPLTCFLCPSVLPYKCTLIKHLQTVHHINRSESLMYKRVNQGGDVIKRLYMLPGPVSERDT